MKRAIFWSLIFVFSEVIYAQPRVLSFPQKTFQKSLQSLDNKGDSWHVSFPELVLLPVETTSGVYQQIIIPSTYRSGKLGEPQLVSFQKIIAIPYGTELKVNATTSDTSTYNISGADLSQQLIPYQPSTPKNEDPQAKELVINKTAYSRNNFEELPLVTFEELGMMRGVRLAKVTVNPLRYNPVTHQLKVYNNIDVSLSFVSTKTGLDTRPGSKSLNSPYFNTLFQSLDVQPVAVKSESLIDDPVRYLLVTPAAFMNILEPFIRWKIQKGFEVDLGITDSIGASASAIQNWIQNQYADTADGRPAPTFLTLVGDVAQIPASQNGAATNRATDLYYASLDGDMFPEMYYGRLPAQDTVQLKAMLDKILMYETYAFPDDSFLDDVTLIAGADATWNPRVGQPTVNYGTENYFNTANGFVNVYAYLTSYTGCYATDKIGVSLINYTAHCSQTSWYSPSLTASTVSTLTNEGKYPVAIGNCCTSGDFSISTCIGEAFVRNPNGGAIGYLGSVPDTYWWEDFYWAVGAHDPVYNEYPSVDSSGIGAYDAPFLESYQTLDALVFAGNMTVTEAHNQQYAGDISSLYYWEAYHCLGDPSLQPYLKRGLEPVVSHANLLESGLGEFEVSASPGSMVALSNNGLLLATQQVGTTGKVSLFFDADLATDSVQLVVTRYRYKPYRATLPVSVSNTSYLALNSFSFDDVSGNNNQLADYGENLSVQLSIENIGDSVSQNIQIQWMENDPYIDILGTQPFPVSETLAKNATWSSLNDFTIQIADSVPDQHVAYFTLQLSDSVPGESRKYYSYTRQLVLNAPVLELLPQLQFDDFSANGNGLPDAGESLIIKVGFVNNGHAQVSSTLDISSILSETSFTFLSSSQDYPECLPEDTVWALYQVQIDAAPITQALDTLQVNIGNGTYQTMRLYPLTIGGDTVQQLGSSTHELADFPFNNYYLNNKSQMLFRADELSSGIKTLYKIAFNFSQITSDVNYRDLANFTIRIKATNQETMTDFVSMDDAELVMDSSMYYLPATTGWCDIPLQNAFVTNGESNLIIEVAWGTNDNYPDPAYRTKVYGSQTSFYSTAYGFMDAVNPPPLNEVGNLRPDVKFYYDSASILNIVVQGNLPVDTSLLVSGAQLLVNGTNFTTDNLGRAQYVSAQFEESLNIQTQAYGYRDSTFTYLKEAASQHLNIELQRNPLCVVYVTDEWDQPVSGADISIGEWLFETDNDGICTNYAISSGGAIDMSITKPGFASQNYTSSNFTGSDTITISLVQDWADISFALKNSLDEAISAASFILDGQLYESQPDGSVMIPDLAQGSHTLMIYHPDYQPYNDTLMIGYQDSLISIYLKRLGDINMQFTDELANPVSGLTVQLGAYKETTDAWGMATFTSKVEGSYLVEVNTTEYFSLKDTIEVYGDTSLSYMLTSKPDVSFYVYDGFSALEGTSILLDTLMQITDANGFAKFAHADSGSFNYQISKSGYLTHSGTCYVELADTLITIKLDLLPEVTFTVTDSAGAVAGLAVTLDTLTQLTQSNGLLTFTGVQPGNHTYQIDSSGYYPVNENLLVEQTSVSQNVFLQEIPDIFWNISQGAQPADSVLITFDQHKVYTNLLGMATLKNIPAGTYSYSLTKEGYGAVTGSISVTTSNVTIYKEIKKLAALTFMVQYNGLPLEGATLVMDTFNLLTDALGKAIITGIPQQTYYYTVSKEGYFNASDSIAVDNEAVEENVSLETEIYTVSFHIGDGLNSILGVEVWLNEQQQFTDADGNTEFSNLVYGNSYFYQVSYEGFQTDTGTLVIESPAIFREIVLQPNKYQVLFQVFDKLGPLSLATINFDNKVKSTNSLGEALFSDIVPLDSMRYLIKKADTYWADTGFVNLTSDTTIQVQLIAIGVDEELANAIRVYPNPTNGKIVVQLTHPEQNFDCKVYNSQGMLVFVAEHFVGQTPIDLSAFSSGVYYLHVSIGEQFAIKRIILKK